MMTIQECLDNFMKAVKGKDVRQALYDSVKQSYDYAKDANDTAHTVEGKTSELLEDAAQALTNANTAVTSANAAAATANTASQTALDAAQKAEEAASQPGEFAIDYTDSVDDAATALTKITPGAKLKDLVSNIKAVLNGAVLISKIANNLTTTDAGMVLGAAMGKSLDAKITALNNNLSSVTTKVKSVYVGYDDSSNVDTLPPGMLWINGYASHGGTLPFANHFIMISHAAKITDTMCTTQIAICASRTAYRHRDTQSQPWLAWTIHSNA